MLNTGDTAPDFSVPDSTGQQRESASLRGGWTLLWWYPEAGSGGCSMQANSLSQTYPQFEQEGITVWGISFNSTEQNDGFSCDAGLAFPLLSDVDRSVGTAFDVVRAPDENHADKPRRVSFVIDPAGQVAFSELVPNEALANYGERALQQVRALQAGRDATSGTPGAHG